MSGDIIETIDGAIQDWTTSGDAMRWTPDRQSEAPASPWDGWVDVGYVNEAHSTLAPLRPAYRDTEAEAILSGLGRREPGSYDCCGLITSLPSASWSRTDGNPLDDLRRAVELIEALPPTPTMVECHTTTLAAFRAGIPPVERIPWSGVVAVPLGIPIVVDPTLPAGTWRVLDDDGNVLHEGTVAP